LSPAIKSGFNYNGIFKGEAMSFNNFERIMFAVVYTAAVVVIILDLFYWRPY